jgi:hypothetical protein
MDKLPYKSGALDGTPTVSFMKKLFGTGHTDDEPGESAEHGGYLPGYFPMKGTFRFERNEFNFTGEQDFPMLRNSINDLLAYYRFDYTNTWTLKPPASQFEVYFQSQQELEAFMAGMQEIAKRFGYTRDGFSGWKTCEHGRYFCDTGDFSQGRKVAADGNCGCMECSRLAH